MIIFLVGVSLLVRALGYIFGVAIANAAAFFTIGAFIIFIGILLFFVPRARAWGIPVLLGGVLLLAFMEYFESIASTLAVVLSVIIIGGGVIFLKVRIFRYLRTDNGRALPRWLQWMLRII